MIARTRFRINGWSTRGSALVELAVVMPVLILVFAAAIDFSRVFYMSNVLIAAARAGAQYGTKDAGSYTDDAGMTAIATTVVTTSLSGAAPTVTPSHLCECVNDSGGAGAPPTPACTAACTSGHMVIHVSVAVNKSFSTVMSVPGIPTGLSLTRTATIRSQ